MTNPKPTKGQEFMRKFAWHIQRFRSIANESAGEDLFNTLYGNDHFVNEEAVEKFQNLADAGAEFDYGVLIGMKALSETPTHMGLRAVFMSMDMYGDGGSQIDKMIQHKLAEMQGMNNAAE